VKGEEISFADVLTNAGVYCHMTGKPFRGSPHSLPALRGSKLKTVGAASANEERGVEFAGAVAASADGSGTPRWTMRPDSRDFDAVVRRSAGALLVAEKSVHVLGEEPRELVKAPPAVSAFCSAPEQSGTLLAPTYCKPAVARLSPRSGESEELEFAEPTIPPVVFSNTDAIVIVCGNRMHTVRPERLPIIESLTADDATPARKADAGFVAATCS
jgi:hypothetical protein